MATRVNFKTILGKYSNVGKGNVRLTQSTLILSKPISATSTVYNFDVLESQTQTLVGDEIRLNLNDEFIIAELGFYLQASIINDALVDTGAKVLLSYAPFEQDNQQASRINNFWNGSFQIAVNNIVYLDKYDVRKSNYVSRTQFSNFVSGPGGIIPSTIPSIDFSTNGMNSTEPMLTLSGAKKNNLTLTLPTAINIANFVIDDNQGNSYTVRVDRVVCIARGLNAQNGASFQN
jgi:hypothetical protein